MKKMAIAFSVVLLLVEAQCLCKADEKSDLAKDNAELRKRVENLEKELSELKRIVTQQGEQLKTSEAKPETSAGWKPQKGDIEKISKMIQSQEQKKPLWSDLDIQLYGYLKLDAAYDTSRINNGNYAKWVESESANKDDNQFNMTANQSRIGLRINGPEDGGIKTSGCVEVDFYGGGAENKSNIMMRHAYMKIDWPEDNFNIIAGQTSDVISPLYPSTLNYSVGWWAGNIGYRRAQIRLTKGLKLSNDIDLKIEAAVARTIGRDTTLVPASESGEDAGFPGIQGRTSLIFPLLSYKPTTLGFSGHWAKEEYDTSLSGSDKHFDSWSLNLDLTQPISKWLTLKGELFTGENLSAYLGGIGQGVNIARLKEIGSRGGWMAAALGPWDKWAFNLGVSIDDVDDDDLSSISGDKREYNRSVFGNAIYTINKNTRIGLELSQWHTDYQSQRDSDSIRAQTSFIYKF
ncbi:MAG: hypothetical protein JXB29_04000 [Sedimentisphaerales bacterium]|nr:hypothetical protein [Sedimentisphaerales bacterium]